MIRQQVELLKTEGVELVFEDIAVREIARMAADLNKSVENIGARRLHTVMELIMEEISFEAAEEGMKGRKVVVDKETVDRRLEGITKKTDLSRFIL
jgi:ATP-dependent HslUV protease ATP-binding subunit HslU